MDRNGWAKVGELKVEKTSIQVLKRDSSLKFVLKNKAFDQKTHLTVSEGILLLRRGDSYALRGRIRTSGEQTLKVLKASSLIEAYQNTLEVFNETLKKMRKEFYPPGFDKHAAYMVEVLDSSLDLLKKYIQDVKTLKKNSLDNYVKKAA